MRKLTAMPAEEAARRRGLVDELGAIRERLKAVKLDQARDKAISDEIRETWMDGADPAATSVFHGAYYAVQVSARKLEKILDLARLVKEVGLPKFLSHCRVTLKAFEELIEPARRGGYVTQAQTGSREIDVYAVQSTTMHGVSAAAVATRKKAA